MLFIFRGLKKNRSLTANLANPFDRSSGAWVHTCNNQSAKCGSGAWLKLKKKTVSRSAAQDIVMHFQQHFLSSSWKLWGESWEAFEVMLVVELSRLPLKTDTGWRYSIAVDTGSSIQLRNMLTDANKTCKMHVFACALEDQYELWTAKFGI